MQPKMDLEYIWIDTCYMNKHDAQEYREDINSIFRYYKYAKVCYVYLSDILKEKHSKHGHQDCEKDKNEAIVKPRVKSIEHND